MIDVERLLKDVNLRLARFGDSDVAGTRSPLPYSNSSSDARRHYLETVSKLVFKIE
jgi:hypothetical protein